MGAYICWFFSGGRARQGQQEHSIPAETFKQACDCCEGGADTARRQSRSHQIQRLWRSRSWNARIHHRRSYRCESSQTTGSTQSTVVCVSRSLKIIWHGCGLRADESERPQNVTVGNALDRLTSDEVLVRSTMFAGLSKRKISRPFRVRRTSVMVTITFKQSLSLSVMSLCRKIAFTQRAVGRLRNPLRPRACLPCSRETCPQHRWSSRQSSRTKSKRCERRCVRR